MNLFRRYISEALNDEPVREPLDLPVPSDLADIADLFDREGEELYIVGGAVRDTMLGKSPKDYDLATGAPPERTIELAEQIPGSRVDLTGKSFGVVRVKTTEGNEYEIATFRRDIGAGRRPDAVEFTDIETDVKRRDLTINALFYDLASGEVVDYVGGIDDLRSGTIKAVGDPAQRFAEDKLRILRAVRRAGRMGSDLDAGTRDAILRDNDLDEVSPERIHDEFVKGIKQAQSVQHFLYLIDDLELFDQILPGASVDLEARSSSKDVPVQLALMLLDNDPISVRKMMREMKFTNDEVVGTEFLLDLSQIAPDTASQLKKQFARSKLSSQLVSEFGRAADMPQKTVDAFLRFAGAPPSASPHDLMRQGLRGPEIGKAMEKAEAEAYQKMVTELRRFVRKALLEEVELTLSTKGLDPTQGLTAFMDEYESMSKLNPIGIPGDRYWYMGEVEGKYCLVMTNIKIDKYRNVIYFNSIQTAGDDCERQGFASEVMNTITDLADKHQVPIRLQAVPFGQKSVPRRSLVAWYKRAGFEQTDSDYKEIMMRQPR